MVEVARQFKPNIYNTSPPEKWPGKSSWDGGRLNDSEAMTPPRWTWNQSGSLPDGFGISEFQCLINHAARGRGKISSSLASLEQTILPDKRETESLEELVSYLDENWKLEGLPREWWKLQYGNAEVGFSMNKQMKILMESGNLVLGLQRTEQDIAAFAREYLMLNRNVYFARYKLQELANGEYILFDPKYQKDILSITSDEERNGAVKRALEKIQKKLGKNQRQQDKKDQIMEIAVNISPLGPTGLKTDSNKYIVYPDSYMQIQVQNGERITNFTIKTDFTHEECRKFIQFVTGIELPSIGINPIKDLGTYVETVGFIKPGQVIEGNVINNEVDILTHALAKVRPNSVKVYKDLNLDEIIRQMKEEVDMRDVSDEGQKIIDKFTGSTIIDYLEINSEILTELFIQKALAATILRLSKLYLYPAEHSEIEQNSVSGFNINNKEQVTFGTVLKQLSELKGCSGGGSSVSETSAGIFREATLINEGAGLSDESCPEIECKSCRKWKASAAEAKQVQEGKLTACPRCGWSPGKSANSSSSKEKEQKSPINLSKSNKKTNVEQKETSSTENRPSVKKKEIVDFPIRRQQQKAILANKAA